MALCAAGNIDISTLTPRPISPNIPNPNAFIRTFPRHGDSAIQCSAFTGRVPAFGRLCGLCRHTNVGHVSRPIRSQHTHSTIVVVVVVVAVVPSQDAITCRSGVPVPSIFIVNDHYVSTRRRRSERRP